MALANKNKGDVWARPGMNVTFRAEVMPGVEMEKRTFRVKDVLPNGSVTLHDFAGEHAAASFLPLQFHNKTKTKI
ncbi:MAG: hypothetical protein ABI954_08365 [Pyrinomonadaceae bacterium]